MHKVSKFLKKVYKDRALVLMALPVTIWLIIFRYIPLAGLVLAFKEFRVSRLGFWHSLMQSELVGWKNFEFLFSTVDAYRITRNTLLYNVFFIIIGTVFTVALAIALSEMRSQKLRKIYQTGMFLPYFLSWVVASYLLFSILGTEKGVINSILRSQGKDVISWYSEPKYWPFILTVMNLWKGTGYGSVVYLAAIVGIDKTYYEAAIVDGAKKWQQIKYITIPMITPLIIILTILAIGRIFYADFGLFYNVPRDSGPLYPVTDVIDTYVFRGLMKSNNIGMSTAAGLYQSFIGFILIILTNWGVKKYSEDYALF